MNKLERKAPVAVIDEDNSLLSKQFIFDCEAHPMLHVQERLQDIDVAKKMLYREDIYGIIYIPKDFEKDIKTMRGATVRLYLDNVRFMISNDINRAVTEIKSAYDVKSAVAVYERNGLPYEQARNSAEPFRLDIHSIFNPAETYGTFLIPAVLLLVLQQIMLFGIGQSVAKEREENLLGEAYETSGNSILKIIFGKLAFHWLFFSLLSALSLFCAIDLFGIEFAGSKSLFFLFLLLFFFAMGAFAIAFGTFFKKKVYAFVVLSATSYPIFLMSGYVWPASSTPLFIRMLAVCSPGTTIMAAFSRLFYLNLNFNEVWSTAVVLLIQAIVFIIIAGFRFKVLLKSVQRKLS
jgi:ABC-2 type transport system permease protein